MKVIVEVDSSCVDWEGDVPQCKRLLTAESDEDCKVMMDVSFINVHLLQGTEEDDIGGGVIVD